MSSKQQSAEGNVPMKNLIKHLKLEITKEDGITKIVIGDYYFVFGIIDIKEENSINLQGVGIVGGKPPGKGYCVEALTMAIKNYISTNNLENIKYAVVKLSSHYAVAAYKCYKRAFEQAGFNLLPAIDPEYNVIDIPRGEGWPDKKVYNVTKSWYDVFKDTYGNVNWLGRNDQGHEFYWVDLDEDLPGTEIPSKAREALESWKKEDGPLSGSQILLFEKKNKERESGGQKSQGGRRSHKTKRKKYKRKKKKRRYKKTRRTKRKRRKRK